ncbi:hypothetical protein [Psychrobacillus vulpis]|uniref:Uncharacterized protein n=1 Tax=Psychrobacillus vulpis TaxID=2325572 RepID=A0A544TJ95_9BACI|nr:hypothetical protein [Psychrobacillus vulpis]TQR17493.1 hypothetical protein FG384_17480 [Psychrobacillus vulpis]
MTLEGPNNELPPNLGLTVGFISSVILSIGYVVGTIGEGIVLYETNRAEKLEKQAAVDQQKQMSDIQSKLEYLINEIEELKKRG